MSLEREKKCFNLGVLDELFNANVMRANNLSFNPSHITNESQW